ncbi:MAG: cell division topological specificity factor MinE, partial [Selenomonadaceae bacterium]|nr:cell division topological specificity factor MinE [Selenomonadaceae bacterium]
MLNILKSLFGGEKQSSRDIARDRLKVVLIHDHANITPEVMEHLREDIIQV